MSKWIRKGDQVLVIAGNEKGRLGKVLARRGERIVVEALNLRSKCVKKSQEHPQGAILRIEAPMHISNVALCDGKGERIRVNVRQSPDGRRDLIYGESSGPTVFRTLRRAKGGV